MITARPVKAPFVYDAFVVSSAIVELESRPCNEVLHGGGDKDLARACPPRDARSDVDGDASDIFPTSSHSPVWTPARLSIPSAKRTLSVIDNAHRPARAGPSNVTRNPSPAVSISFPPKLFSSVRTTPWCACKSSRHRASPSSAARSVEPTMSVNSTVPRTRSNSPAEAPNWTSSSRRPTSSTTRGRRGAPTGAVVEPAMTPDAAPGFRPTVACPNAITQPERAMRGPRRRTAGSPTGRARAGPTWVATMIVSIRRPEEGKRRSRDDLDERDRERATTDAGHTKDPVRRGRRSCIAEAA